MHIKKTIPQNKYGKYFLATEAPGDGEEPSPRRNVKTIDIKPNKRVRTDFTADAIPEEEPVENTDPVEQNDTTPEVQDDTDFTADDTGDTGGEDKTELTDDDGENVDFTTGLTDSENGDGTVDTTGDNPDANAEATDGGNEDDVDFTADTDTGDTGEEGQTEDNTTGTGEDGQQERGPGLEYASTRKYILFIKYMDLYSSVQYYLDKMDDLLKDDNYDSHVVKDAKNHMQEEKDLLSAYMTTQYPGSTYVQNLLFYNKMIATVQLIFNQLEISKKGKALK